VDWASNWTQEKFRFDENYGKLACLINHTNNMNSKLPSILAALAILALSSFSSHASVFTDEEKSATFSQKEVEQKPVPVKQEQPRYTRELEGLNGNVYVAFIVCDEGKTKAIRCIKSTDERLNDSVLDAISKWKFEPANHEGENVAVRCVMKIRVDFA
jgi:TonB family protein